MKAVLGKGLEQWIKSGLFAYHTNGSLLSEITDQLTVFKEVVDTENIDANRLVVLI